MSENWEDVVEKHYLDILKGELRLALQKLICVLQIWKKPTVPLRAVEMIGPFAIHLITFIVFEAFKSTSAIQSSFFIYILCLVAFLGLLKIQAGIRMLSLSLAQIFSIMSYSQIWFIPFVFLARFFDSWVVRVGILTLPLVLQAICVWRLVLLIVTDDSAIYLAISHIPYGVFFVVWAALSSK